VLAVVVDLDLQEIAFLADGDLLVRLLDAHELAVSAAASAVRICFATGMYCTAWAESAGASFPGHERRATWARPGHRHDVLAVARLPDVHDTTPVAATERRDRGNGHAPIRPS